MVFEALIGSFLLELPVLLTMQKITHTRVIRPGYACSTRRFLGGSLISLCGNYLKNL